MFRASQNFLEPQFFFLLVFQGTLIFFCGFCLESPSKCRATGPRPATCGPDCRQPSNISHVPWVIRRTICAFPAGGCTTFSRIRPSRTGPCLGTRPAPNDGTHGKPLRECNAGSCGLVHSSTSPQLKYDRVRERPSRQSVLERTAGLDTILLFYS